MKVSELIHQLQASESTIRRDLQELEAQGVLVRIRWRCQKDPAPSDLKPNMKEKTKVPSRETKNRPICRLIDQKG